MKIALLITWSLASGCMFQKNIGGQTNDSIADSLKKYSYLLTTSFEEYSQQGTGFFIRSNGQLYLMTAKHFINGGRFPKALFVWLSTIESDTSDVKKVDMRSVMERWERSAKQTGSEWDVVAIPVNDTIFNNVYSVESLVRSMPQKMQQIEIYGYPIKPHWDYSTVYGPPSNLHIPGKEYKLAIGVDTTTHKEDQINYYIYTTAITIDSRLKGYSGAPVFVKNSRSKQWCILGSFAGHTDSNDPNDKAIKIVRLEYILKEKNIADAF